MNIDKIIKKNKSRSPYSYGYFWRLEFLVWTSISLCLSLYFMYELYPTTARKHTIKPTTKVIESMPRNLTAKFNVLSNIIPPFF